MILVNFKTYQKASGQKAISLAQTVCDVAGESGVEIISCPQTIDLREVVKASDHPVWAQHVDPVERSQSTGWLPPEVAKEAGAKGVLLNHSEHKLSVGVLGETLTRCKEVGLETLVFADSLEEARVVAKFKPDWIGYEPPELIASPTTSVARSRPEVIEKVVASIPDIPLLVGAGVKDGQDVKTSLTRGAKGVVVASAVVLADNPNQALKDLTKGFKK